LNIARIFPQAHFIIIWRDPMECCRSTKWAENFQEGFDQKGMLLRTLLGAAVMAEGVDQLRRDGRRVHEVVYANLVKNSEAELRDICKFLEISFDARMLNLETADRTASPGLQPQIIHSALKGKQLLPPAFVVKCERYAALWFGRYAHLKFAEVLSSFPNRRKPGITEQWMDRGAYFFWRRVDVFKWFVFRHIPLSWWELFRKMKSKLQPNRRVSNADENQLTSCETTVNAEKF
jgi:Sulfotransferase family